jgi:diguanylate cyclase (GGDEF)-like protein
MQWQGDEPGLDFRTVAERVLTDLQDRVGLDTWFVARQDGEHEVVLSRVGDDLMGAGPRRWADTFGAPMMAGRAPTVAPDVDLVPAFAPLRAGSGADVRACLCVPLPGPQGWPLGVLSGLGRQVAPALGDHLTAVQLQAELLGTALGWELHQADEVRRQEAVTAAASSDDVTGLPDRRAWDTALRAEELRAVRLASGACVAVVSIDDLAGTNSRFGRETGDRLLKEVAETLRARLRDDDLLARLGGAHFGVVLTTGDLSEARAVADRLGQGLRDIGVSAAVGVARRTAAGGMVGAWHAAVADQSEQAGRAEPRTPEADALPRPRSGDAWLFAAAAGAPRKPVAQIDALLHLVREQLGMDAAFLNTFEGPNRRIQNLVSSVELPIAAGFTSSREGTYCDLIARAQLDPVTPDVSADPTLAALPVTEFLGIASYIGIPLHREDGSLYGTLCAFSQHANPELRQRDTRILEAVADLVMNLAEAEEKVARGHHEFLDRLDRLYAARGPRMVYQDIYRLDGLQSVGVEALSRFPTPGPAPDVWFTTATRMGAGVRLELAALLNAVETLPALDDRFLALNVSPATIMTPAFHELASRLPLFRIVLEITEHEAVEDYDALSRLLAPYREDGLRIAVDDAGAGFASMRHILALVPDFIKLDISLVRGIDADAGRQALAAALTAFADRTDAVVIAEGIETETELRALRDLDVGYGQGYFLGRPGALLPPAERVGGSPR